MSERLKPGSRPPLLNLHEALQIAERIYEQGGGRASKDLASRLVGNTTSSSAFIKKINSLKSYGLAVEEDGEIILSHAAMASVAPTDAVSSAEAKKTSFQQVDLFNRIYSRLKGKILPADEFLRNIFEQDFGIPRELVKEWIDSLKVGLKAAGLIHDRGDGKWQIMESPIVRFPRLPAEIKATPTISEPGVPPKETESLAAPQIPTMASGHNTRIEVSGKRFATFSIPDVLTKRDAQKLKSALGGLASIIDSMVAEEES